MVESVQEVCKQGIAAYATTPRTQWVLQWPGQVVLTVSAIFWTQEVSGAMSGPASDAAGSGKGALSAVAANCTAQLGEVVGLVRGELSNLNRWAGLAVLVHCTYHSCSAAPDQSPNLCGARHMSSHAQLPRPNVLLHAGCACGWFAIISWLQRAKKKPCVWVRGAITRTAHDVLFIVLAW